MNLWFAIAIGGASGAVSRYWMVQSINQWLGKDFPYGTLFVNVSGSFLLGFLSVYLWQKIPLSEELKLLLTVGFFGSYTTFSTFSLEVLNAMMAGAYVKSIAYILSSVLFSLIAVYLGFLSAKFLS